MTNNPSATRRKYSLGFSQGNLEIEHAQYDGRTLLSIPSDEAAEILLRHREREKITATMLAALERLHYLCDSREFESLRLPGGRGAVRAAVAAIAKAKGVEHGQDA